MGNGGGDVKGTQKPIKRAPNTQDWKILSKKNKVLDYNTEYKIAMSPC